MHVSALLFGARGSGSFVQAGTRGLEAARDAFGGSLALRFCEDTDPAARTAALEDLAREGADLIVVHGGQGEAPLSRVAPARPAQRFSLSQGHLRLPNVACYEVVLEQPAFLAGALAAWCSRSGVLAHLSGERVGPGLRGLAAFRAGALHAVPGIDVRSHFCGQQHNAALAADCARAHARTGADVLFTMLGEGRAGAIQACRETGMKQIGDVDDWCARVPDVFIASAVADSAWCAAQAVRDAHEGRFAGGVRRSMGLGDPAVCRLALHPDLPTSFRQRVEALHAAAVAYVGE
jgi:basic membrane protein A